MWKNPKSINQDDKVLIALLNSPKIVYEFKQENLIILGPRQVGKTTYLKLFIKNLIDSNIDPNDIIYFSCEPLLTKYDLITLFKEIAEIDNKSKKYIFLDEVTSILDWEMAVKYFLEQKIIS